MERYSRQIILPLVGLEGQTKFAMAKVLVVGCGGLGHPASVLLAGAGIGQITVVDGDNVSIDNLHRQVMFTEGDVGKNKAIVLASRLSALNSEIVVKAEPVFLTTESARNLISSADVVLDCTDDLSSRYSINDFCVTYGKAFVSASIHRNEGQLSVFNYHGGPTYRCLYPEWQDITDVSCAATGVMGSLTSMLGSMQANECLKVILGQEDVLSGKLLLTNILDYKNEIISFEKSPDAVKTAVKSVAMRSELQTGQQ